MPEKEVIKSVCLCNQTRDTQKTFYELAHSQGVLDAKTKELMHIVLVLAFRCEP